MQTCKVDVVKKRVSSKKWKKAIELAFAERLGAESVDLRIDKDGFDIIAEIVRPDGKVEVRFLRSTMSAKEVERFPWLVNPNPICREALCKCPTAKSFAALARVLRTGAAKGKKFGFKCGIVFGPGDSLDSKLVEVDLTAL